MRDYDPIAAHLRDAIPPDADRGARLILVVDALWNHLHDQGVSWVGFYLADDAAPEDQRLILGPRRDTPACSPIGLHGVCGSGRRTGEVQIVRDTADLGDHYVACDPRDRSEIVVPLFEMRDGRRTCWGVLDLDSWDVGAFDETDAAGLARVLTAAGLEPPGGR